MRKIPKRIISTLVTIVLVLAIALLPLTKISTSAKGDNSHLMDADRPDIGVYVLFWILVVIGIGLGAVIIYLKKKDI